MCARKTVWSRCVQHKIRSGASRLKKCTTAAAVKQTPPKLPRVWRASGSQPRTRCSSQTTKCRRTSSATCGETSVVGKNDTNLFSAQLESKQHSRNAGLRQSTHVGGGRLPATVRHRHTEGLEQSRPTRAENTPITSIKIARPCAFSTHAGERGKPGIPPPAGCSCLIPYNASHKTEQQC